MTLYEWQGRFLVQLLIMCALSDLTYRRISNYFLYVGVLAGGCYQFLTFGLRGLFLSASAAAVVLVCGFPFFLLRMFGAGDVKLLSVLVFFAGPGEIMSEFFWIFISGGVISLWKLVSRRAFCRRMTYFACYVRRLLSSARIEPYTCFDKKSDSEVAFAVPVLIGTLLNMGVGL